MQGNSGPAGMVPTDFPRCAVEQLPRETGSHLTHPSYQRISTILAKLASERVSTSMRWRSTLCRSRRWQGWGTRSQVA
jgi:hypothetical protein